MSKQQNNQQLTWQQQEDLAQPLKTHKHRSRRPPKKPLHHGTDYTACSVAKDIQNSALAQQTNSLSQYGRPQSKQRAQPTTSLSPHHAKLVAPAKAPLFNRATTKHTPKLSEPSQKKAARNKNKKRKEANMTPLRKEAYIPPHLRNRTSANGAKAGPEDRRAATNGPPPSSDKSKSTAPTKVESTPHHLNVHQVTPPSPATTPQEPAEYENQDVTIPENVHAGWDEPKAKHPQIIQKGGDARWPRGSQPYKRTPWPKQKDMKYVPSSIDSDGGVGCRSNSNGDPDYDIKKLLDWNGDWLPAPESWSARKGYDDRHLGENVERWMNGHAPECVGPIYYPPSTFSPKNGVCKELAPRYWLEAKVEGSNLRESWKMISTSHPKPLDDMDLTGYAPWWELYEDVIYSEAIIEDKKHQQYTEHASCYLNALPVPEARIDPADTEYPIVPQMLASAADKVLDMKNRREAKQRRLLAKRARPVPESKCPVPPMEDRRLRPQANIYIRPVQPADVIGIATIYNYYIENTIHAVEFDGRTEAHIRQRINDVTSAGLPYLVAISKSNQSRATPGYVNEKIVGFINLDDYCSQSSLFRYTFEMELFVHPGFTSKGIGKCLVDRLLEMADTSYRARGGYEYVNNYEYLKTGPSRVIKTILLNLHHEHREDATKEWQGQFLNICKFHRVGRLPKVGYKHNKTIDVSIYAHHTKEEIDANARPTVAG